MTFDIESGSLFYIAPPPVVGIEIMARYFFKKNKTKLLQSKSKCPRIVRVVIK